VRARAAPLRPSPNREIDAQASVKASGTLGSRIYGCSSLRRTILSKPLAYPSTLDHRHACRRDGVLRGGALEPGARGDVRKIASVTAHLKYQARSTDRHTRGPFSLRRGLNYSQSFFKLSITFWF